MPHFHMPRGGKRYGAGRKPIDPSGQRRWPVTLMLTKDEESKLREALDWIRTQAKEQTDSPSTDGGPK